MPTDEERDLYETKSSAVILALSGLQDRPTDFVSREAVLKNITRLERSAAEQQLGDLIARNVVEMLPSDTALVRLRVPLFALWLKRRGPAELWQAQAAQTRIAQALSAAQELSSTEVLSTAEGLVYKGKSVTADEVRRWASQFGDLEDQRLMLRLLQRLRDRGLYSLDRFTGLMAELHKLAARTAAGVGVVLQLDSKKRVQNWYVTHADADGKSGSSVVRQYRLANGISEQRTGAPEKVAEVIGGASRSRVVLSCVDDFVGSGQQAAEGLTELVIPSLAKHIPDWRERVTLIYAAAVGYESGLDHVRSVLGDQAVVIAGDILTEADKAFSPKNDNLRFGRPAASGDADRPRDRASPRAEAPVGLGRLPGPRCVPRTTRFPSLSRPEGHTTGRPGSLCSRGDVACDAGSRPPRAAKLAQRAMNCRPSIGPRYHRRTQPS